MTRHLRVSLAAAAAALLLAGCGVTSNGNGGMTSSYYDQGAPAVAPDVAVDGGKIASGGVMVEGTATTPTVIRTGDMTLETTDVAGVFDRVKQAVLAAGGRIESSGYYGGGSGSPASGQVVARIPEPKLDGAIDAISALATRTALNVSTSDVTLQRVDLEAKVKALTAARDRLQDLVSKATKVSDLIEAENALAQRQAELDSYTGQLDYLKSQAAESTLSISIASSQTPVTSGLRGWGETFRESVRNFLGAIQSVIVFVGTALPWAFGILLLVGLVRLVIRGVARLRARRARG